ncbi:family 20 glycosylhydrolase [Mucilaginibacter sp.]|uniref:family 20 glycosylhydrolase n=1 Tax=Mucilaginibacter sp. TaxID=1882438 RepID=UPI002619C79C|nr:family 20 glycosylhydrolase [Mucilaginibacter sp.]MDB4925289.1 beta-N-acetylhexosaminidase [Mucilaginibacter sp.]
MIIAVWPHRLVGAGCAGRICFLILLTTLLTVNVFAQPGTVDLRLKWGVIENNYGNKPQSLSELTLITRHQFTLPAKGWKLYFNFGAQVVPHSSTGNVSITPVNGDLFYLSPTADFKGINKNDSLKIQFVASDWLINKTDAPRGFYLIWDNAPTRYYVVKPVILKPSTGAGQFSRSPLDKIEVSTPQLVFEQNKTIPHIPADSLVKIFPTPQTYQLTAVKFKLDRGVKVIADAWFKAEALYLKKELARLLLPAVTPSKNTINLVKKQMPEEAYELVITNNRITIAASSGAGIFYGLQSLKTLISPLAYRSAQKAIRIQGVKVADQPRFGYRAVMIDVARNFQSKKQLLKLLDLMGLYKLNVLHFHLTDDEGWRLEIPALPELTAIGAKRGHTLDNSQNLQPSFGSGPFTNNRSGSGYYTRADFIELLKYATERHIKIIPEIESPGHARAAIKAMDARYDRYVRQGKMEQANQYLLHDRNDSSKYISVQYWNDNVIDVSLPSTYDFMEIVTREIKEMYAAAGAPLQTIHFGGDEVPAGAWERSPAFFRLRKADTTIKRTDDLWPYYYRKIVQMLNANSLYLTAWEEAGSRKVVQNGKIASVIDTELTDKNIHLEVWNNVLGWGTEDLAYKLANRGYKVILSCVTNLYFDLAYVKAFDEPGYYWGGYADVANSFRFIPYDYFKNSAKDRMGNTVNPSVFLNKEKLTAAGKNNIIGLQGALWSENLQSAAKMEYMLLPKLLGLAERAWARDPDWATVADTIKSSVLYDDSWARFVNILGQRELPRLTYYAGGFNYRIPSAGVSKANGWIIANSGLPGFEIHYTTDGKIPTLKSAVFKDSVKTGRLKIGLFNPAGRSGKIVTVENK